MPQTERLRRARRVAERRISSRGPSEARESYSSSLLESLWRSTPEPDYELAARSGAPKRPAGRIIAGALAVFLGLTGSIAVVHLTRDAGGDRSTSDYLISQIEERTEENGELAASNDERAGKLERAQSAALGEDSTGQLDRLSEQAGMTEMTGPGTTLTLEDQDTSRIDNDPRAGGPEGNKVHDEDIQIVINAMFAGGAYAVAVNDHRVTSMTAVRSAGGAILVNYDPLTPPYAVTAIGPEDLVDRLEGSQMARYLSQLSTDYGIGYSVATKKEATVPAADLAQLHYAHPRQPSSSPSAPDAQETQ